MLLAGFEPAISASELPMTHALDARPPESGFQKQIPDLRYKKSTGSVSLPQDPQWNLSRSRFIHSAPQLSSILTDAVLLTTISLHLDHRWYLSFSFRHNLKVSYLFHSLYISRSSYDPWLNHYNIVIPRLTNFSANEDFFSLFFGLG